MTAAELADAISDLQIEIKALLRARPVGPESGVDTRRAGIHLAQAEVQLRIARNFLLPEDERVR